MSLVVSGTPVPQTSRTSNEGTDDGRRGTTEEKEREGLSERRRDEREDGIQRDRNNVGGRVENKL